MNLLNKTYVYALDPSGFMLSLFYLIILSGALVSIARRMELPFSDKSIVALYLYYYLFFLFTTMMPIVPNFPDTELFSQIITANFFPETHTIGVRLFYYITSPLRMLSFLKLEPFILFQLFIFLLSLMIVWKSWQIVTEKNGIDSSASANIFLLLSALYPSFLLFIPIPLREFWVLFGFSILVYGIIKKYYEESALIDAGLGYILLGSLILLTARPQLIVVVIIFLALFQKNRWVKYGLILASFFLIPYLFTALTSYKFTPEFFGYLRNYSYAYYDGDSHMTYGKVAWESYFDMLKDIPLLFLQFVLSPFPILHAMNPMKLHAIFADMLFTLFVYFFTLYAGLKVSKIYLFIFLVSAALFSLWEFHLGGAVRHRMPLVMILLPVASYGVVRFYHELRGR